MKTKIFATTLAALMIGGVAAGNVAFAEETIGQQLDDATLVARIKADLLKSRNVDGLDVNVDAKNGKVTLSGSASTEAERTKAEVIAKGTSGVKSVENRIAIKTE